VVLLETTISISKSLVPHGRFPSMFVSEAIVEKPADIGRCGSPVHVLEPSLGRDELLLWAQKGFDCCDLDISIEFDTACRSDRAAVCDIGSCFS